MTAETELVMKIGDEMTKEANPGLKFAYLIIGIAVPMGAYLLWTKTNGFRFGRKRHQEVDRAHDITVEDSFPASDPPSAW